MTITTTTTNALECFKLLNLCYLFINQAVSSWSHTLRYFPQAQTIEMTIQIGNISV